MKISHYAYLATAAAMAIMSAPASAADIVNTGPVPAEYSAYAIGGSTFGASGVAGRFTLTAATAITAIQFYGASLGNNVGSIKADGATPMASLYSQRIGETDNSINQWVGLTSLNWLLGPGSYWVTFEAPDSGSAFRESRNFPNPLVQQAYESAGVWTTAVPGGSSTAFAFRVQGDAVATAVPELASWAMMIGGFGSVGGAMRRRRRAAVRFA